MNDAYEILGLDKDATKEQVEKRYDELRGEYREQRFLPGEAGEIASEKLQQIETAYNDVMQSFEKAEKAPKDENDFTDVQKAVADGKLDEAQELLDEYVNRSAEWHYVQALVFYKRSWYLESKKQLEFALQIEPNNKRYKDSLDKLTKILASNTVSPDQMRTTEAPQGDNFGAGNGTCTGSTCTDCLLCNACCNCIQCIGCH